MMIIVPCSGTKTGTDPAPARDLYGGTSFTAAKAAAIASGRPWRIMSARYGLIDPDKIIEPYDLYLRRNSTKDARALSIRLRTQPCPGPVESWCPNTYTMGMRMAGWIVLAPLWGLRRGERIKWWQLQQERMAA